MSNVIQFPTTNDCANNNNDIVEDAFTAVMNASDEQVTRLFADMGIEINLSKPFEYDDEEDEGYLIDEL